MSDDEGGGDHKEIAGTRPLKASAFRKGGYILLKGHPCKVMEMTTSKTGKHGHAKVKFVGVDIFSGKKYQELMASTHNMPEVIVTKAEYTVLDINDDNGLMQLVDDKNQSGPELHLPPDDFKWSGQGEPPLGYSIYNAFHKLEDGKELNVSVTTAMGHSEVQGYKVVAAKKE